tara:strand:+ start:1334 stop:2050 length:717 start_codon:yes stop_codon:yes gene_type:complete
LPGKDDRREQVDGAVDDAFDLIRSQKKSRRNLYLLVALFIVLVFARQFGFFGDIHEGQSLPEIEVEKVDELLAKTSLVPRLGDAAAPVRVIEFFDYACGHCRRMAPLVDEAVAEDERVSVIMLEYPVLGRESQLAARYALAAELQGSYAVYHRALMFSTVPYTDEGLTDLGKSLGLDAEQLNIDAYGAEVEDTLVQNRIIGKAIGVDGTPTFVVGDILFVGAIDKAAFFGLIASQMPE